MDDPSNPYGLRGQSVKEFLQVRPGETRPPQPSASPDPVPTRRTPGMTGYLEAGAEGAAWTAPVLAGLSAAAPFTGGLTLPVAAAVAGSGAAGGMIAHGIEQNFPEYAEYAPLIAAVPSLWGGGMSAIAKPALRYAGTHVPHVAAALAAGAVGLGQHGLNIMASAPSVAANVVGLAVATGVGVGGPALYGLWRAAASLPRMASSAPGSVANMFPMAFEPAARVMMPIASAVGAAGTQFTNYLLPPSQPQQPQPVAEAPIPVRPPEQLPQPPRSRLEIDAPR